MKDTFQILKDKTHNLSVDYEKLVGEIILYSQEVLRSGNDLGDCVQKIATPFHLPPPKLSSSYIDRIISEIELIEKNILMKTRT